MLPLVGSMMTDLPGVILPCFSSASIIATPMRSLTEWAGFQNSSFAATVVPDAMPAVTRFRRTRGVPPMSFVMSDAIFMCLPLPRRRNGEARPLLESKRERQIE